MNRSVRLATSSPPRTFKCPLCKEIFTEQALRDHKCRCLMDGHRRPRRLLEVQLERIVKG